MTPDDYLFETPLSLGSTGVTQRGLTVTNIGTMPCTFRLQAEWVAREEHPWTLATSTAGFNAPLLKALFHPTKPSASDFGPDDVVLGGWTSCTEAVYSAGEETGVNVPVGESRTLWMLMDTPPTAYRAGSEQISLSVNVDE